MTLEITRPPILAGIPTLESLASDPAWVARMKQAPKLPSNLRHVGQTPWTLWACVVRRSPQPPQKPIWSWARSSHTTYAGAWNAWVKSRKENQARIDAGGLGPIIVDWSIVCNPRLWDQPLDLQMPMGTMWCPRCRRPVVWRFIGRHHAIQGLSDLSPMHRCPWCGIREDSAWQHQASVVQSRMRKKAAA
jgi:hypothetical protein